MAGESLMTVGEFAPFAYGKGLPERMRNPLGHVPVFGSNGVVGYHDTALTNGPTVVIGRKGTVGTVHYSPVPCWPIDTTFFVTGDDSLLVRFKYYALKALGLEHMNSDSAVPGLNRDAAHARPIRVPIQEEQRAIAHILGTLDDKIELNRRMNATLEAMAQAIFKSWFADFDPVRAKAEGRDPHLPKEIAELFPGAFEVSELGGIPAGWRVVSLDEVATYMNGLALQKFKPDASGSLPVIKIAQLRAGNTEGADQASASLLPQYIVEDGDVLFSWSGSLEVEVWCGGRGALNQHLFKVTSDRFPKWFYLYWTRQHLTDFRGIAAGKATTMGHIQRSHLSFAKALIPPPPLLEAMSGYMAPLIDDFIDKSLETRTLAALRDTLLPKLISGEVRVKDAELFIGRRIDG